MDTEQTSFRDEVSRNEPNNEWRSLVITAIIGIILGFIIGYFVFIKNIFNPLANNPANTATSTLEDLTTKTSTSTATTKTNGLMTVEVPDQTPSLRTKITKLVLSEGAWVVTFSSTEDMSRPNLIIGAQYFNPGTYTDITSYLAQGLVAGEKYFVALYQDDAAGSTEHVFDSVKDKPFTKGAYWIMDSFEVTAVGARG
ncbi:MAG: hypothetical protein A2571_02580 [Candidatus Vogelbacteria bacterium RIFOXYD1_FULL_44_32]|uniref:DUF7282 domain-containing protein n=1 Tax=Candidatus Vogelbacteria bacterium RIFOXYD1_FULL_44_32 TaxID=1802438 RepID=A0A1G2QDH1_9BACT|nr:MAG: hypothetical protein A2571_02580 [Candidatus Vogelbacteria bacterium RIFOXYD1_FULL_44_32]